MDDSDAKLVEDCLEGDVDAFEALVRRHQDSVYTMNLNLTRYNPVEAADLTQEAFIRAYRKLHLYKPRYSFRNWLLRLAANVSKNRFRDTTRRRDAEQAYAEEEARHADYRDDPRRAAVLHAMKKLPENLRLAVSLKHTEGLSYDEMSEVLGIGVSAAKMRVSRGIEMLTRLVDLPGRKDGHEAT